MMRALLLFLTFGFISSVIAQDRVAIDSLHNLISSTDQDTLKCEGYLGLGEQYYRSNADSGMLWWGKAKDFAASKLREMPEGDPQWRTLTLYHADAMMNMGYLYKLKGEINTASSMYEKALDLYKPIDNKMRIAYALNNIGIIFKQRGDIKTALEYYHQCMKIQIEIGDKMGEATSLNNMAALYGEQGDRERALDFNLKSLALREEIGDKHNIANSLSNLGAMHFQDKNYTSALGYFKRSLSIMKELNNKQGMSRALQRVGGAYCRLDSTELGFKLMKEGLAVSVTLHDIQWIGYTSDVISMYYLMIDELDSAERYAEISMKQAKELNFPMNLDRAAERNYEVYKAQGRYEAALEMYELHVLMRDSLKNEQTQKATIRQQTKYEFEKAQLVAEQARNEEQRIANDELIRRDNLQYSVILLGLLILGSLVLGLGRLAVPPRVGEGLIFFSFLILFEFILVLADPYIEGWSGGAPGIKLLFNAGIAALIFPAHAFFESKLKGRLVKP